MTTSKNRPKKILITLFIILILCIFTSFVFGRYTIHPMDVINAFLSKDTTYTHLNFSQTRTVLFNVRVPRVLLSTLVGCSLACSGAAFQGVFQNPMASPDILGASAGAAFGASLAIFFGLSTLGISTLAFSFSLFTVAISSLVSKLSAGNKILNLILAGMVVKSLFTAGVSFIKLIADPSGQLQQITFWLMGSFSGATRAQLFYFAILALVGLVPIYLYRWNINILTLGDEEAKTLGVDVGKLRIIIILSSTILTAACVSVSGMIGWVGLIVPHISRRLVGDSFEYIVPCSMLTGAIFLLMVDNVARNLLSVEIPIGILTAIIGSPSFIYLLIKKKV